VFEAGERWLYSTSTDWVGRLVEKVSGQSLEDYFRQHIFTPLGMADTFYFVPKDKEARLVTVNRRTADGSIAKESVQPPTSGFTPIGGGGLSSTAYDYLRFTAPCSTAASSTAPASCRPARSPSWGKTTLGGRCPGAKDRNPGTQ